MNKSSRRRDPSPPSRPARLRPAWRNRKSWSP